MEDSIKYYKSTLYLHNGDDMAVVNVHIEGELDRFVQKRIHLGYATSKAEVIRQGLIKLKNDEDVEDISDDPELEKYLLDIQNGKIKPKMSGPYKNSDELFKDLEK